MVVIKILRHLARDSLKLYRNHWRLSLYLNALVGDDSHRSWMSLMMKMNAMDYSMIRAFSVLSLSLVIHCQNMRFEALIRPPSVSRQFLNVKTQSMSLHCYHLGIRSVASSFYLRVGKKWKRSHLLFKFSQRDLREFSFSCEEKLLNRTHISSALGRSQLLFLNAAVFSFSHGNILFRTS